MSENDIRKEAVKETVKETVKEAVKETIKEAENEAKRILREAKKEAKRIVEEAKAELTPAAKRSVPITQMNVYDEVEIELFADSGSYAQPLPVKWGGRQFLIPRGIRVRIPAPVAEIIRICDAQEHKTAALIRRLEKAGEM